MNGLEGVDTYTGLTFGAAWARGPVRFAADISMLFISYGVEGRTYVALLVGLDRIVPGAVEVVEDDVGMLHDNLSLRLLAACTWYRP